MLSLGAAMYRLECIAQVFFVVNKNQRQIQNIGLKRIQAKLKEIGPSQGKTERRNKIKRKDETR